MLSAPAFAQDADDTLYAPDGVRKELREDIHQDRVDMKEDLENKSYKDAAGEFKDIRKDKVGVREDRRDDRQERRVVRRSR